MSRTPAPALPPRRFWATIYITDTPVAGENYLTEGELRDMILAMPIQAGVAIEIANFTLRDEVAR